MEQKRRSETSERAKEMTLKYFRDGEAKEIRKRARALEKKTSSFPPLVNRQVNEGAENIVPQLE